LSIALIRAIGKRCGIKQIRQAGADIQIYPEAIDFDAWTDVSAAMPGRLRMAMSGEPHLNFKCKSGENVLALVYKMFVQYEKIAQEYQAQA
jgi:hypothetical protein